MKSVRVISLFLALFLMFIFVACNQSSSESVPPQSYETELSGKEILSRFTPITDPQTLQQLNEDYIHPFSYCILGVKDPTKIPPDSLIVFYLVKERPEKEGKTEEGLPIYPREKVESCIQKYFDVSTEYLRKARMYNEELECYHTWGIGSTTDSKVVGAFQLDDYLLIQYEYFSELRNAIEDVTVAYGTVLMKKNPENNGEYQFIYDDCHELPEPSCTVIGESF